MTVHLCVDIRGVLRWSDAKLAGMFAEDGRKMSGAAVREKLLDYLSEGKKVLPAVPDCEGFSYETGCPGHEPFPESGNAEVV